MADAVVTRIIDLPRQLTVHLACLSDGTGESAVTKVTRANYLDPNGVVPTNLKLVSARWCIQGFSSISILWKHTANDTAMILSGSGYDTFNPQLSAPTRGLADPNTSGDTVTSTIGDVLLTSRGAAANASYDITLVYDKT